MANITQKINTYVYGISQQPDHLKLPGQVRNLVNALPDITLGCQKRPGSEIVAKLETTKGGKWFTIFRDENEKYLVQYLNGGLRVWSAIDGTPRVVRYSSTPVIPPLPGRPDIPSTPGGGGGAGSEPPPLPVGCDTIIMNAALTAWLSKKSQGDSIQSQINTLQHQVNELKAAARVEWRFQEEQFGYGNTVFDYYYDEYYGVWVWKSQIVSEGLEYRKGYLAINTDDTRLWAVQRWASITVIDQASIDSKNAQIASLTNSLNQIRAEEVPLRKTYEQEALKCNISASPRSRLNAVNSIPYLTNAAPEDIDVLVVNDYAFITNKKMYVSMGGRKSNIRPHEAFVTLKVLEYNSEYKLDITAPQATADVLIPYATSLAVEPASWEHSDGTCLFTKVATFDHTDGLKINMRYTLETRGQAVPVDNSDPYSGYKCSYKTYVTLVNGGQGWVTGDSWRVTMEGKEYIVRVASHGYSNNYQTIITIPPYLTPKDQQTGAIKPDAVLAHFKTEIEKNFGWFAKIISSGLYITGPKQFSAFASGGRSSDSLEVMTNKVNNIARLPIQCKDGYVVKVLNTGEQEDDYYVKFVGTEPGVDGAGAWEETIAPGISVNINYTTMPHQLIRMPDGTFSFSPVDWDLREVGDNKSNPEPSFIGKTINKMFFHRNRLGMLADENVVLSRTGDFFNYWSKTALTISDDDPIDMAVSSTQPCVLYDTLDIQNGMVLFSENMQYLLTTSNDTLTPTACKIKVISTYNYNPKTPLVDMGTTIGFLSASGRYARFFEMTNIGDGTAEILEQSKIVSELIPSDAWEVAQSKENSLVAIAKRGDSGIVMYRYFNDGTKRVMSSWFQWTVAGHLEHHVIDNDNYYRVLENSSGVILTKTKLVQEASEYIVDGTNVRYVPRLDMRSTVYNNAITYTAATDKSTFVTRHPYTIEGLLVFGISNDRFQGRISHPESITKTGDYEWTVTLNGDWSNTNLAIGYPFTMKVQLPTIFFTQTEGDKARSDTRMYLTVHRAKFQFGAVGLFNTTVKALSKSTKEHVWEMSPSDSYDADTHEVLPTCFHTLPLYDKNLNLDITLTSTYPTPCTLLSMEWEGKASPLSYKSV